MIKKVKQWINTIILEHIKEQINEQTNELKTCYRLIDETQKGKNVFCGEIEWATRPLVGDKIFLNKNIPVIDKPKVFLIKEVFISATGFTGVCKGNLQQLKSDYY